MRKNIKNNPMSVFYQIRETTGMNQSELADLLDTNVTTLSRWENGKSNPNLSFKQIKTLDILLKGMGLSLSDLPDDPFGRIRKLDLLKCK